MDRESKKNKFLLKLAIIVGFCSLMLASGCTFETGCNSGDKDKNNNESNQSAHQFCIWTDDTNFADAELDKHYFVQMPEVINRAGEKVDGFELQVKKVEDEKGKEIAVSGGKVFTPKSLGSYTITFYCPDDVAVKESSIKINCVDTTGPKINTSMVNSFVFSESGFNVPEFEVTDKGGVDESSKKVTLFDSIGNEIIPVNGRYENVSEGNYTYRFEASDTSGNESVTEKAIYVTGQKMIDGKLTYLSANDYKLQTYRYGMETFPTLRWSKDNKDPDGNETLLVMPASNSESSIKIVLSCAISNWAEYDYWGAWVYNPTSEYLACGLLGSGDTDSYILNPNSWTYVCRTVQDYLVDGNGVSSSRNEYSRVVLNIYDRFTKDGAELPYALKTTDKFYVSNLYLYKDETDNVFSLGEKFASKNLSVHQKYMDYGHTVTDEYKFGDDSYSSKFTFTSKTINSFNLAFSGATSKFNKSNPRYLVNVYNPNNYDIVIIDNSCDNMTARGDNCSENFSTVIKAGETAQVLFKCDIDKKYAYFMVLKTDGSKVESNFVIYFSNVKTSDNYTGDDSNWNSTYGDVNIWNKYLAKNGGGQ